MSSWSEQVIAVHADSDRPAAYDRHGPVTGRELVGRAASAIELLAGLPSGVPVPALLTSNADALALIVAGAAVDRPLALLGPRLTVTELVGPVRATGSPVLLTEPEWADTAIAVAAETGVRVVTVPALRTSTAMPPTPTTEIALHLHTSGTTGAAKRVPITQDVLSVRGKVVSDLIALDADSRYATGSPLHHLAGGGSSLVALGVGATLLPTSRFTLDWWRGIRPLGVTHCLLVPSMIETLLAEGLLDAVPLRTLVYGASPMSPFTLRRVLDVLPGVRLVNLFGQTEGSPITALTAEDHERAAAGAYHLLETVGRAAPGLKVRIDAPDAEGVGEVLAAGPHMAVHSEDGWLHTGDLGSLDADGYLTLVGRRHDMVVRGGENVYPLEVEQRLATHPLVADAGVVGVPDQRLGETLAAFVVPTDPSEPPTEEQLRAFVREQLAGFKVPAHWYLVEALPLNSAGKLMRGPLKEQHLTAEAALHD